MTTSTGIGAMMRMLACAGDGTLSRMLWRMQQVDGDDDAKQRMRSLIEWVNSNKPR